jgi:RNA polymerase sigma-70 factor (ECF subfamily)
MEMLASQVTEGKSMSPKVVEMNRQGDSPDRSCPSITQWASLVERVQRGDSSGLADLYLLFSKGIRFYLCRQLGPQELDDRLHDVFLIVVQAIRRGDLREPERLMGFVRTVVRRQVAGHIDKAVQCRKEQLDLSSGDSVADMGENPEERAIGREKTQILSDVLSSLSPRDREVLTRFYIQEHTQEQICDDLKLSDTQFRLLKSRAKARFGQIGRKRLVTRAFASLFVRKKGE